jgi:hypothetical protein
MHKMAIAAGVMAGNLFMAAGASGAPLIQGTTSKSTLASPSIPIRSVPAGGTLTALAGTTTAGTVTFAS